MSIIASNSMVFDIGAHIGTTVQQFLEAGAKTVVAVEPCLANYLELISRPNTIPIMAACWNKNQLIQAFYAENASGWSTVQPNKWIAAYPDAQWATPQWVPCITLDQLRETFGLPHLVKIDVEGSEFQVISGMHFKPQYVIFEFHKTFLNDTIKCLRQLQRIGFSKAHYVRDNLDLDTEPTTHINEFVPRFLVDDVPWGNITCS